MERNLKRKMTKSRGKLLQNFLNEKFLTKYHFGYFENSEVSDKNYGFSENQRKIIGELLRHFLDAAVSLVISSRNA